MKTLVFLEHHEGVLQSGSLGVLSRVATIDPDVAAVVAGQGPLAPLAAEAGRHGAAKVFVAEGEQFAAPMAQPHIDLIEQVVAAAGVDTVLFSSSVLATDIAGGLSARLEAGLNWDLIDVVENDGALVGQRLALQDSVLVNVGWVSQARIALFRGGSFEPVPVGSGEPEIEQVTVVAQDHSARASLVDSTPHASEGPSIAGADVIVAGGIGLGSAENFALAEELAGLLGGAVGATRAAVYKGWYPASAQIGQTGETVTPKLYVALGISGAVQHKVGMQNSKVIVAVNTDANAPIFEFSDLAVVGDVHTVIPQLVELLRARKGA